MSPEPPSPIATEGSETINGSATDVVSDNYGSKTYYSDGSKWFTVPLLAVTSHTLASHSAKAHSDLTGIDTGDHHAEAHTTPAASTTAAGHAELSTIAETNTGTDTGRVITPDELTGSVHGEKSVQMVVFDSATDVATGDGKFYFHVPGILNGINLVAVPGNSKIFAVVTLADLTRWPSLPTHWWGYYDDLFQH